MKFPCPLTLDPPPRALRRPCLHRRGERAGRGASATGNDTSWYKGKVGFIQQSKVDGACLALLLCNCGANLSALTRSRLFRGRLKRPRPEQKVHDVSLVRLEPVQLDRRDRTDVEPIDVGGVYQLALPLLVRGNG